MTIEVAWELSADDGGTGGEGDGDPRPLTDEAVAAAAEAALAHGERPGAGLSVVFVDDPTLTAMHAEHLDDPTPTDVITFDLGEEGGGPVGELYVSVDRARDVAGRRGVSVARELALYVVHGALHLCGYDDHGEADRERMRAAEGVVMRGLGYGDDPGEHDEGGEDPQVDGGPGSASGSPPRGA